MKTKALVFLTVVVIFTACGCKTTNSDKAGLGKFNPEKDLLLVQYDCKTDVDDLHTVAAFATLMSGNKYSEIKYHAVAGTYGIQEGLYVPPNALFELAFGENWTDAHENTEAAVEKVKELVKTTLAVQGDIWIADAGQSDFTARLVKAVLNDLPDVPATKRFHVVQHSDWNEEVTSPESLAFVKKNTDYHKIPDGNAEGNGTPGFRSPGYKQWKDKISDPELTDVWQQAITLANKYNGKDGRYTNEAILAGGLDFSDLVEVCWIMGLQDIKGTRQFFSML